MTYENDQKKKLIIMYIQWTPMMWMDHLFSYDMNLDEWLSKFGLDGKYYRKELLVLNQEKKKKDGQRINIYIYNPSLDFLLTSQELITSLSFFLNKIIFI